MAGNAPVIDPIHQFEVNPIAKLSLAGYDISFTNASLYMIIVVAVITAIMVLGSAGRSIIPGRLQAMASRPAVQRSATSGGGQGAALHHPSRAGAARAFLNRRAAAPAQAAVQQMSQR